MALKVSSSSSPSIGGERCDVEFEKDRRNKSDPVLSHAKTRATEPMTVADTAEVTKQILQVDSFVSSKLKEMSDGEDEREAFIQHFITKFKMSREVAEAQYNAFI